MGYIMDTAQLVDDRKYSIRTQISLSRTLYRVLKDRAKRADKSLAQIIRENVVAQLRSEENRERESQLRLKELTEKVRQLRGKSGWAEVKNPHQLIRKWRREEDEP